MKDPKREQAIRKRAHEIYLERVNKGSQECCASKDWQKAENEFKDRDRLDILFVTLLLVASVATIVIFSQYTSTLYILFWLPLVLIVLITGYTTLRGQVCDRLFGFLRACFVSCLAVISAVTFLFQYWPTFRIEDVQNLSGNLCAEPAKPESSMPDKAFFVIKNQSNALVVDTHVRFWFLNKQEQNGEECSLCFSPANADSHEEDFTFGPQEKRRFLFDFGKFKNSSREHIRNLHALFLIVQLRYKVPIWPFSPQTEWAVFNYSPENCVWSSMRKEDPAWKQYFRDRYQTLNQSAPSLKSIPPCQISGYNADVNRTMPIGDNPRS